MSQKSRFLTFIDKSYEVKRQLKSSDMRFATERTSFYFYKLSYRKIALPLSGRSLSFRGGKPMPLDPLLVNYSPVCTYIEYHYCHSRKVRHSRVGRNPEKFRHAFCHRADFQSLCAQSRTRFDLLLPS